MRHEIRRLKGRDWLHLFHRCLFRGLLSQRHNFLLLSRRVSRFIQQHNYNSVLPPVQEIRLTRALFVLVFTFAGLWIPTFLAIVSFRLLLRSFISQELVLLVPYLVNLSSALNPRMYGFMSPLVRDKIKKSLFSKPRLPQSDVTSLAGEIIIVRVWEQREAPREPHHTGEMLPNVSF